jgi:flagellar export protein FliJ
MARFVYRLQKVYELRERRKKEQEQRVTEANNAVRQAEQRLVANHQQQQETIAQMEAQGPQYFEMGDRYLQHLRQKRVTLQEEKAAAVAHLKEEEAKLAVCHQELEALEKHKERCKEEWMEEEKAAEMKLLDEIGSQRYFRSRLEAAEEAVLDGEVDPAEA